MSLLLPIIAFVLLYLALRRKQMEWRRASLGAAVLCGAWVTASSELLSIRNWLTRPAVIASWFAVCLGASAYLLYIRRGAQVFARSEAGAQSEGLDRSTKLLLYAGAAIVLITGIVAFVAAPSTWDVMEYHLPRVILWMSDRNVRFFPTADYCRLVFGPWAEYAMMHTMFLWGTDRFVNFVELFSMIGSAVGVSWIAKMLGAGTRGQGLAAIASVTIPVGILEASGAMNTYVVSFWIMTTVAFLLSWNATGGWFDTVCVGLAAGIAMLTKGHAFIYLPFFVLACWWAGSPARRILFIKRAAVFVLLILAMDGAQFWRCYRLTGSPLGAPFADGGPRMHWSLDDRSPRQIAANIIRNSSIYLATPFERLNRPIDRAVRATIRDIGVDPDDPRATWPGYSFSIRHLSLTEVHAVSPLQAALILVAIGIILFNRKRFEQAAFWYSLAIIFGFVFFCAALRWQNWQGRHHLPLLVLGAAISGLALEKCFSQRTGTVIAAGLLVFALPFVVLNRTRSLLPLHRVDDIYHPRAILYFNDQHEKYAAEFIAAADAVNQLNCRDVAVDEYVGLPASQLMDAGSLYVYPIFPLIHAYGRSRFVWFSGVDNLSARYAGDQPRRSACAVVCLDCVNVPQKWDEYRQVGGRASVFGNIVVFGAKGQEANAGQETLSGRALSGAVSQKLGNRTRVGG